MSSSIIGRDAGYGFFEKFTFTFDGVTSTYPLPVPAPSATSLMIVIDGVLQEPNSAYVLSSGGSAITFSSVPLSSSTGYGLFLGRELLIPQAANPTIIKDVFTPTIGQTIFTLSSAPVSSSAVLVILNGTVLVDTTDYTITGTNLVLVQGTETTDTLIVINYGTEMLSIVTPGDNTITTSKLANNSVTTPKIVDGSVTQDKLAAEAVGFDNLDLAVDTFVKSSRKNAIINGGFDIWQRGTSQTSSGYGSDDRWLNANTGSTKTHSRQTFALGQTDVPGNPAYFSRTVVTSVAGANNYVYKTQSIESVLTFAGQTVTLSFWAKADSAKQIAVEFAQYFGTGGSTPEQGINPTKFNLTTAWQKFTLTTTIPSISGKALGTANTDSLAMTFWFDAGSNLNARTGSLGQQSGTFDIALVQLENGSVATEFERQTFEEVFEDCLRYYEVIGRGGGGLTVNSTSATINYVFNKRKRIPPTVGQVATGINVRVAGSTSNIGLTIGSSGTDVHGAALSATRTSGTWTAGQEFSINDSPFITFDSEL